MEGQPRPSDGEGADPSTTSEGPGLLAATVCLSQRRNPSVGRTWSPLVQASQSVRQPHVWRVAPATGRQGVSDGDHSGLAEIACRPGILRAAQTAQAR